MKKILFFSSNIGKINEIRNLFKNYKIKILSNRDFNIENEPNEYGSSFAENAKIKSLYGYKKTGVASFADDSGICIEALKWKPNIYSKRFINSFKNRDECFRFIINKVKKSGKNKAYFQTSICLTLKNNYHIIFEGRVSGKISHKILGVSGFGFDPIFVPGGYSKSFGELTNSYKNKISHRSIATNKLISFLFN